MSAIVALKEKNSDVSRDVLVKITEKYGYITPEYVIQEARNEENPLHDYFNWDDNEAGHLYRLMQARFLIRTVKLDIIRQKSDSKEVTFETTRAYVSPPSIRGKKGGKSYLKLQTAMDDAEIRTEMLERAKIELKGIKNRYKQLTELSAVWDVVEML